MGQLTFFDVSAIESKKVIASRLEHYGIDDYYRKNIKGKVMQLSEIDKKLNALPNYSDYIVSLIEELKKVVPVIPYLESFERGESCLILDGKFPRIYTRYYNKNNLIGSNSPLFCLEAIDDDFFK